MVTIINCWTQETLDSGPPLPVEVPTKSKVKKKKKVSGLWWCAVTLCCHAMLSRWALPLPSSLVFVLASSTKNHWEITHPFLPHNAIANSSDASWSKHEPWHAWGVMVMVMVYKALNTFFLWNYHCLCTLPWRVFEVRECTFILYLHFNHNEMRKAPRMTSSVVKWAKKKSKYEDNLLVYGRVNDISLVGKCKWKTWILITWCFVPLVANKPVLQNLSHNCCLIIVNFLSMFDSFFSPTVFQGGDFPAFIQGAKSFLAGPKVAEYKAARRTIPWEQWRRGGGKQSR